MDTDRYHIVVAEDHELVRRWIKRLVLECPDLEVVGEASNGMELLELLKKKKPHLVLLDISMPHLGGLEAIAKIKDRSGDIKILVLTMHKNKEYLERALSLGADGYLLKEEADTSLHKAIAAIMQGERFISPPLLAL
jgi:DNA-binding NarL/FixJ family response regulator